MKKRTILMESALFRGIAEADLQGLLSCLEAAERVFRKGEAVFHRGDRTERVGLLLSGIVHIVREDFWGNRSIVGIAGTGDIFAAVMIGGLLRGDSLDVSIKCSADFISAVVADAIAADEPVRDGVQLEKNLYRLL